MKLLSIGSDNPCSQHLPNFPIRALNSKISKRNFLRVGGVKKPHALPPFRRSRHVVDLCITGDSCSHRRGNLQSRSLYSSPPRRNPTCRYGVNQPSTDDLS